MSTGTLFNQPKAAVHLPAETIAAINSAAEPFPIPQGKEYGYGTAGFRMKANAGLDHVMFTVGLIAAARSKKRNATIGVMITASHNPPEDNGVKLVDPMGDMLEQSWEGYATTLANTHSDQLGKAYEDLINEELVDELRQIHDRPAKVIFGRDTRPSGIALVKALKAALDALKVEYTDYGILTTPQLHYLVRCINTKGTAYEFGEPTEQGYYEKMANAFKILMHGRTIQGPVTVDCANGVGGPKLRELIKYLPTGSQGIEIKVLNDDVLNPEVLNHEVGPQTPSPNPPA